MEFKNWLTNRISERGLKPSEVAYHSGLSQAEISRLINGKRLPTLKTIKKLSKILHSSKEEMMQVLGYLPPDKEQPKTVDIPLLGEIPASTLNFVYDDIHTEDYVTLNAEVVKDKNCIAAKVSGECLSGKGVNDGDIVIISPKAKTKNGDIVIVRVDGEVTMKLWYQTDHTIVLQPCNNHFEPIILNPKQHNIEIIGKVVLSLKRF